MKVANTGPMGRPTGKRAKRRAGESSEGFKVGSSAADPAGALSGVLHVAAVDALLSVQEVDDPASGPAKQLKRGHDLLDRLEDIRLGLLTGAIPGPRLAEIKKLVQGKRQQARDPRLRAVLEEIELRAEVELEKLAYRPPGI